MRAIRTADDNLLVWVAFFCDLTERKKNEGRRFSKRSDSVQTKLPEKLIAEGSCRRKCRDAYGGKERKMKKIIALLLALVMVLPLVACGKEGGGTEEKMKIGVILPSGRGDLSIGDAVYGAVVDAQKLASFDFDYAEVVNASDPEYFLREFADSTDYDLIVVATFTFFDALKTVAPDYPDQKFLAWDLSGIEGDNIAFGGFLHEQTTFVAGAFAALMDPYGAVKINGQEYTWTPSGKFGCIIAMDTPIENQIDCGFQAGVKYIDPSYSCSRGYTGSYSDQAKAKELSLSMYDAGIHFIVMGAGGASYGTVEAAKELGGGHWAIGFDQSTNNVDVHVIGSALNDTSAALATSIADYVNKGVFNSGEVRLFGYTTNNQSLLLQDGIEVPEEVSAKLDDIVKKVSSGEIKIPTTLDEVETFSARYAG